MHIFYLHGFASSARSSKARFLAERLAPLGLPLHCPDFNEPDFSTLTVTRMIDQVEAAMAACPPAPIVLVGSSLGAFVAWHVAARESVRADALRPISHLVLLAPALDFGANLLKELGEEGMRLWRETNRKALFHYAFSEPREVHYALFEDSRQYVSAAVHVSTPGLVFQGTRDAFIDPEMVAAFAAERPALTLHLLNDDHQLLSSLDTIWERTAAFLGLRRSIPDERDADGRAFRVPGLVDRSEPRRLRGCH